MTKGDVGSRYRTCGLRRTSSHVKQRQRSLPSLNGSAHSQSSRRINRTFSSSTYSPCAELKRVKRNFDHVFSVRNSAVPRGAGQSARTLDLYKCPECHVLLARGTSCEDGGFILILFLPRRVVDVLARCSGRRRAAWAPRTVGPILTRSGRRRLLGRRPRRRGQAVWAAGPVAVAAYTHTHARSPPRGARPAQPLASVLSSLSGLHRFFRSSSTPVVPAVATTVSLSSRR